MTKIPERRLSAKGILDFLNLNCNITTFLSSNSIDGFIGMINMQKRNSIAFTSKQRELLKKGDEGEEKLNKLKFRIADECL